MTLESYNASKPTTHVPRITSTNQDTYVVINEVITASTAIPDKRMEILSKLTRFSESTFLNQNHGVSSIFILLFLEDDISYGLLAAIIALLIIVPIVYIFIIKRKKHENMKLNAENTGNAKIRMVLLLSLNIII